MANHIISLSLLIIAVLIIRALFKKRVSARITYALWLVVLIKLCIPVNFITVDAPIYATLENIGINVQEEESTPSLPALAPDISYSESVPTLPAGSVSSDTAEVPPPVPSEKVPDATIEKAPPSFSLKDIFILIWAMGSAVTLISFSVSGIIMAQRLRKSRVYHSTENKIKVYVSDKISTPCVTGIIPSIYITPYAAQCKDLSLIIKHEMTHIRHADHIWAYVRILFAIAFWWNPLIWAAIFLSRRDAEVACDESVVKSMDMRQKLTYSHLIVDMIPKRSGFVVAFSSKPIKYRVLRLTGKFKTTIIAALCATFTVILACTLAFVSNGTDEGEKALIHIHYFKQATCTEARACKCSKTEGEPLGHKWKDATCASPKTCKRCKLTEGMPLPHTWVDATCKSAMTCSVCKAEKGEHLEHTWIDATCTAPSYCSLCHDIDGKALGHSFADATCTSPKTCSRCLTTEGDALGHSFYLGVCQRCQTVDSAFYAEIKSKFYSPYDGYSKKSATKTLTGLGYNSEEAEFILSTLNINWYEQALIAARFYTSERYSYTEENFKSNMKYLGFTDDQVSYAIKIAMEEDPPERIVYNYNFPDFSQPEPGTYSPRLPGEYNTGNDVGGYNGEPISWGDPYSNIDKKPSYNTGYGYRPGVGYRP